MQERDEEHFSGKVAQKGIISQGNKILITRGVNDATTWEIPGGRLNTNEDPKSGLARELYEELGVHCDIGRVVYVEQHFHKKEAAYRLLVAYTATMQNPEEPLRIAQDEVAEVQWITKEELPNISLFDSYRRALEAYFETL
ncbi:NUDIX hydrolase [Candidatus Parcubacteria bacterium]|uniref:Nudix hydrolase domain-containing protein n=1 Tax=Candidatus Kaiserbacteria bacterium CG10_big_fil_rev_8_21_14_0_10_47_16 TaxID=1974608 RepID=A0A2H0UDV7_9BACT|nr:NUDIX hydrolase [Candidatus Parcubacteria bacterium]PIR84582.1 MAG: hypothetical protein COU16_03330 [Candidatus Kaiserbacteria bacterium CG10_big_fil_rev_8_21_14_0_10_47_16]